MQSDDPPVRRTKSDRTLEAAKALAPGKVQDSIMTWQPTDKVVSSSTTSGDAKDLLAMLMTICRYDPARGAKALVRILNKKSNRHLKDALLEAMAIEVGANAANNELVLSSIRRFIAHHTNEDGGTRTLASETSVKCIVAASLFGVVKDDYSIICCLAPYSF